MKIINWVKISVHPLYVFGLYVLVRLLRIFWILSLHDTFNFFLLLKLSMKHVYALEDSLRTLICQKNPSRLHKWGTF